jgi:lipopolysaccharide/colanic/teichoic acid biosynthesis glycosyltransferase
MRIFDILISLLFLIILSPVLLIIALTIKYKMGSPVLFKQLRPGFKEKPFIIFKFRTMRNEINADGIELPDSQRLDPFGKFLRSTSLDELPELWNVYKGDMSFVGPRPLLMEYLPLYSLRQARRHNVKPGITGWAQINGRNSISWNEKLDMDVWYVDNKTFLLDLKILFLTLFKVIKQEGINKNGYITTDKFKGN